MNTEKNEATSGRSEIKSKGRTPSDRRLETLFLGTIKNVKFCIRQAPYERRRFYLYWTLQIHEPVRYSLQLDAVSDAVLRRNFVSGRPPTINDTEIHLDCLDLVQGQSLDEDVGTN